MLGFELDVKGLVAGVVLDRDGLDEVEVREPGLQLFGRGSHCFFLDDAGERYDE